MYWNFHMHYLVRADRKDSDILSGSERRTSACVGCSCCTFVKYDICFSYSREVTDQSLDFPTPNSYNIAVFYGIP